MNILLFARHIKEVDQEIIDQLVNQAVDRHIKLFAYREFVDQMSHESSKQHVKVIGKNLELKASKFDLVLSLGGDGTMLGAVMVVQDSGIPILGINFGRLGFLATVNKSLIAKSLDQLVAGSYSIEDRSMLYLVSSPGLFDGKNYALNDFTLHKRDTSSMITIHTYINGDYLNSYWADGLIVSTPTGSTGYSLSCGGPIVFPGSGNFIITPVAPHNLNVRPLVVSDKVVVSFEIEGRSENFLCTLDSRSETITAKHQLAIRRNDFNTRLVHFNDMTFLKSLQQKLSWGMDKRN